MKDLISKELAIKLKEIGFDEPCIAEFRGMDIQPVSQLDNHFNYSKNSEISTETNYWLSAPTYEQVKVWFMNEHLIFINIICHTWLHSFYGEVETADSMVDTDIVNDYHKAFEDSINKAIELVKKDQESEK
jgi:hypothetical protein